ncbi:dihydrofolate reductase family protein [Actinokineospora soli]|uniref:Dihydrofolate reductase family protein n=1 Tax=Actinokineospora soli TaxID=1048753 RepID=A0ABW2TXX6_9PSEU
MRKIVASFNMSLDGVTDHMEEWHFQYFDKDAEVFAQEQLFASDALLMGRLTYEGFAEAWPGMDAGEFGVKMNTMPHYVVSSTLESGNWGDTTIIRPEAIAEEIGKLKAQPGGDILMYGYGPLAHELLRLGLLDEIRVWLHPVLSGHGDKESLLFRDGTKVELEHTDTKRLGSGVNILFFTPAKTEG